MNNLLKKRIMRRVYAIYVLRKVFSSTAVKIYAVIALLVGGIAPLVHVKAVADNMPDFTNLAGLYEFSIATIINTEIAVQLIVFGIAVTTLLLMKDVIKTVFARGISNSIRTSQAVKVVGGIRF